MAKRRGGERESVSMIGRKDPADGGWQIVGVIRAVPCVLRVKKTNALGRNGVLE